MMKEDTMNKKIVTLCCVLLLLPVTLALAQAKSRLPARKKIIEYGWDWPTPAYVAANTSAMEKRPFDGIIMGLAAKGAGKVFRRGRWNEEDYAPDMEALGKIKWDKFTDNFIMMYAASKMDWFSDKDWEGIVNNVEIMAKAAKAGRCGLAFDPEPYGKNPWHYSKQMHAKTRSFAEYQAKVRERGAQFIEAVQKHLPETVLFTLFSHSIFPAVTDPTDRSEREQLLSWHVYGLYPAFLNGIMDAMGPGVTLADGNEPSYYYTASENFFAVYHRMRQTSLGLVSPENIDTFLLQTQASQALYFDQVFNTRRKDKKTPASYMTEQERLKWWEHNVYWALKTSDEYVWLYSERMDWWKNDGLPSGMEQAVISARNKITQGEPLGFNIGELIAKAKQKQNEATKGINLRRDTL